MAGAENVEHGAFLHRTRKDDGCAGVYGMNFDHMPELHWVFGYPVSLLLMALSAAGIWIASKRAGWL